MIAYSLNQGCQSIAKTKNQQIQSLIQRFSQSKMQESETERKEAFKNIIRNRFQVNEDELENMNDENDVDIEIDDDSEAEEEGDDDYDEEEEKE